MMPSTKLERQVSSVLCVASGVASYVATPLTLSVSWAVECVYVRHFNGQFWGETWLEMVVGVIVSGWIL